MSIILSMAWGAFCGFAFAPNYPLVITAAVIGSLVISYLTIEAGAT